jgi:hypothetical protein
VQGTVGGGAESRDVTGVGWYFWFDERNGRHRCDRASVRFDSQLSNNKEKRRASLEGLVVSRKAP